MTTMEALVRQTRRRVWGAMAAAGIFGSTTASKQIAPFANVGPWA
jgi:hypothetical protein